MSLGTINYTTEMCKEIKSQKNTTKGMILENKLDIPYQINS